MSDHGAWLPLDGEKGMILWWLQLSHMLFPLQCAAFPDGLRYVGDDANKDKIGNAATVAINRAFGFRSADGGGSEGQPETLRIPVRGIEGHELRPHLDNDPYAGDKQGQPELIWSCFLLAVGVSCLLDLTTQDNLGPVLDAIQQAGADYLELLHPLSDSEKELFRFTMDVIWSSLYQVAVPLDR